MAASSTIGALRVALGLDSAQFTQGAKDAEGKAERLGNKIGQALRAPIGAASALKGAIGALAGALAANEILAAAQRGLEYASSLGEVAQQLGITTKDLQEYRFAATQVGVAQEDVDKGLAKLTLTMGQAREGVAKPKAAFKELSDILGRDILKNAETAGDAIPLIADALAKVPDPARRAALEVSIFGKTGQRLDTLLAGGADSVNQLRDAAQSLGIVLSQEQIDNADRTADKLTELKLVLEANIAGAVATNANAIYDFVTALESLIGKIPMAVNELGKFRAYLNLAQGVLNGSPAEIAAARADLDARANFGKPTGGPSKPRPARVSRGDGAGTSDAEAKSGASKAASDAKRRAADAKRAAEEARRREQQFAQDLSRSQEEQLRAQLDLTVDQTERVNIQQTLLDNESAATIEAIRLDQDLTAQQKKQLTILEQETYTLRARLLHRQDQEILARQELDRAQAQNDNQTDVLNAQAGLARTAKERGRIELQILDLQFESLRLAQQAIIDSQASSDQEKQLARDRLRTLGTLQGLARTKSERDNAGPLQQYIDSLPRTTDEVNEALEKVQAEGLAGLIDGISNVEGGFRGLADTVSDVSNQIVSSLLKIAVQKGISALFGSLFPGASRGDPFAGAGGYNPRGTPFIPDSSGINLSGYRAKGGSVIAGRAYMVGERGPEPFIPGRSGTIIPNDAMMGGRQAVVQIVADEGAMFVPRVAGISGDVSVETVGRNNRTQARAQSRRLR